MMSAINFSLSNPLAQANADQPEDLYLAVRAEKQWTQHSLRWTENILIEWTADAFNTPNNREGRDELLRLIQRIKVAQDAGGQSDAMRERVSEAYLRWDGIAAVLAADAHRESQHAPEVVERRTHMAPLRAALAQHGPDLPVGELPDLLKLSASRISQLLSLAQAAGLIHREKKNGQRIVNPAGKWLGEQAPILTRQGSARGSRPPAGRSVFAKRA